MGSADIYGLGVWAVPRLLAYFWFDAVEGHGNGEYVGACGSSQFVDVVKREVALGQNQRPHLITKATCENLPMNEDTRESLPAVLGIIDTKGMCQC